jgi:hypothetical protein
VWGIVAIRFGQSADQHPMSNFGTGLRKPFLGVIRWLCWDCQQFAGQSGKHETGHVLIKKTIRYPSDIIYSACSFMFYY